MIKELLISLFLNNVVVKRQLTTTQRMHKLYSNSVHISHVYRESFSENLFNERGNIPCRFLVPNFSGLNVISPDLTSVYLITDRDNNLFGSMDEYWQKFPNLISQQQYNECWKLTSFSRFNGFLHFCNIAYAMGKFLENMRLPLFVGLSRIAFHYVFTKSKMISLDRVLAEMVLTRSQRLL